MPELIAKIRNDSELPPPSPNGSSTPQHSSDLGKSTTATFVPANNEPPEDIVKAKSGAVIETISSGSSDEEGGSRTSEEADKEVLNSMHHHGDGQMLPSSTENPEEDRLEK